MKAWNENEQGSPLFIKQFWVTEGSRKPNSRLVFNFSIIAKFLPDFICKVKKKQNFNLVK